MMTATYSPDDNKLRLYPAGRLPKETYDRVRAAGFKWAPKQELFVAPMWTPAREDLALELCGEIGDEDTTLVERAAERAERFDGYGEKREADAHRAKAAIDAVADGIPFGQPILVGHHSEKRARKDKEKIEAGMRKAVKLWETSKYWAARADGAVRHAKYKELPAVRFRRIKALEADLRRVVGGYTPQDDPPHVTTQHDRDGNPAEYVWCGSKNYRGGTWVKVANLEAIKAAAARWVAHYEHRIAYETAMLGEQGGIAAAKFDLAVGGKVLTHGLWLTVTKLNKKAGAVASVSTNNKSYPRVVPVERIKDYTPPSAGAAAAVAAATKLPPLCNYPCPGFVEVTQAEWNARHKDYKGSRVVEATETAGRHRVRSGCFGKLGGYGSSPVFITEAKVTRPPAAAPAPAAELPAVQPDAATLARDAARRAAAREGHAPTEFDAMKDAIRSGVVVQVVAADQLFPTPAAIAEQVVGLAGIEDGMTVLEPSAGTGSLLRAVRDAAPFATLRAVEIDPRLCEAYANHNGRPACDAMTVGDFLTMGGELGTFDRVVMNPPFANGADVRHFLHARGFLKPGGKLVSVVANGPRQRARLEPLATAWIDLPAGSFAAQGTGVNAAIVVLDAA